MKSDTSDPSCRSGNRSTNPHRCGDTVDRLGDLLRMRATRPIGIRQDHDVAILEIRRQPRSHLAARLPKPSWPQSRSSREHRRPFLLRRSKSPPCSVPRSAPAVDTVFSAHQACPWPSRCRPSELRKLLLACPIPALSDLPKTFVVFVAIDVLADNGPAALPPPVFFCASEFRQAELSANVLAAILPVVAREAMNHETFAMRSVRLDRQATIAGVVPWPWAKHLVAADFALEQLCNLLDGIT